jgi:hypothetical protein
MNRRNFLAAAIGWLASLPVVGKLVARQTKPPRTQAFVASPKTINESLQGNDFRKPGVMTPVRGHPALERLKKSVEYHRHMPTPPVANGQQARDFYLALMRKEKSLPWAATEVTYMCQDGSRQDVVFTAFGNSLTEPPTTP